MANVFQPFGFRAFGALEGSNPTCGLTRRYLSSSDANSYFTGDAIALSTASAAAGFINLPSSGVSPTNPIVGIFAGCEFFSAAVGRQVFSPTFPGNVGSSSPCNAYTIEGEDSLFIVQCSTTATIGTSNIGMNIGFTSSEAFSPQKSGNATTGISNVSALSSTVSALSSLPFRIVDTSSNYFPPGTNGTDGTSAGAVILVSFNNTLRRSLTGQST